MIDRAEYLRQRGWRQNVGYNEWRHDHFDHLTPVSCAEEVAERVQLDRDEWVAYVTARHAEDAARRRAAAEPPPVRIPLCVYGCCFECATCASKTGTPTLCEDCLRRRRECPGQCTSHLGRERCTIRKGHDGKHSYESPAVDATPSPQEVDASGKPQCGWERLEHGEKEQCTFRKGHRGRHSYDLPMAAELREEVAQVLADQIGGERNEDLIVAAHKVVSVCLRSALFESLTEMFASVVASAVARRSVAADDVREVASTLAHDEELKRYHRVVVELLSECQELDVLPAEPRGAHFLIDRLEAAMPRLIEAWRAHRDVRECECGQPWRPVVGLYGTTEETECQACTLREVNARVLYHLRALLKLTEKNMADRDLSEAMPHAFFVAMGVADAGAPTPESTRIVEGG